MTDIIDLADRRQPVTYTVRITHHWDDRLEVFVEDVADDERSRASVADALFRAAKMFGSTKVQEKALIRELVAAMDRIRDFRVLNARDPDPIVEEALAKAKAAGYEPLKAGV